MRQIGREKAIVVVISEKYLHSPYCMFELLEIYRKSNSDLEEFRQKIYPIVLEDAKIYESLERAEIIKFWRKESEDLEKVMQEMELSDVEALYDDFKVRDEIARNIGVLVKVISNMNTLKPKILAQNNFEIIKNSIMEQLKSAQNA